MENRAAGQPIFVRPRDERLRERLEKVLTTRRRLAWRTVTLNEVAIEAMCRGLDAIEAEEPPRKQGR